MSHRLKGFEKESDRMELEKNFTFAATFWLEDPLRDGVKQILGDLKNAGSSTVILSGDHEATVVKTIEELGLNDIEGEKRCISGEKFRQVMAPHFDKD
jgi:P-type E1-E2 ATPase